jgi:hypothetical protein
MAWSFRIIGGFPAPRAPMPTSSRGPAVYAVAAVVVALAAGASQAQMRGLPPGPTRLGRPPELAPPPAPSAGLPALTAADADVVRGMLASPHCSEPLQHLAAHRGVADRIVTVYLEIAANGTVARCEISTAVGLDVGPDGVGVLPEIRTPRDLPLDFRTALREKFLGWTFEIFDGPGSCSVELRFGPLPPAAVAHPGGLAGEVAELITRLGDESFEVRERALARLIAIGEPACRALQEASNHPNPEVALRVAAALTAIASGGAPTLEQLEGGQVKLRDVSGRGLEHLLRHFNRRKDADYAAHGGQPGPESGLLWKWVQAVGKELSARGYTSIGDDQEHTRRPDGTVIPIR